MMTFAQVVKMSVTTTDNSPSQDYTHPNDQTTLLHKFSRLTWFLNLNNYIRNRMFENVLIPEGHIWMTSGSRLFYRMF